MEAEKVFSPTCIATAMSAVAALLHHKQKYYPRNLPYHHPFRLSAWRLGERALNITPLFHSSLRDLNPIQRELEIHRCYAEALLVEKALSQSTITIGLEEKPLPPHEEEPITSTPSVSEAPQLIGNEELIQRALGILPALETRRFQEIHSCPALLPRDVADDSSRLTEALTLIANELGEGTALAYGMLIIAGLRARTEFENYGTKLDNLFQRVISAPKVAEILNNSVILDGKRAGFEKQFQLLSGVREQLWHLKPKRSGGTNFLFTKLIDAYLSPNPTVGNLLGLAVLDGYIISRLGYEVRYIYTPDRTCLEILIDSQSVYWDPGHPSPLSFTPIFTGRRVTIIELLGLVAFRLGNAYFSQGLWDSAIKNYRWATELFPDLIDAYTELAAGYIRANQPNYAIETLTSALKIDPNSVALNHLLGNAYVLAGDWRRAIAAYKKAANLDPEFAEPWYNMGLAYEKMALPDQAIAAFKRTLEIKPDYSPAYLALGNIYLERQNLAEAVRWYREAIKHDPSLVTAHYNLGRVYHEQGDLSNAIKCYQKALEINPKYASAWYNLGIAYRDKGEKEKAVEAIEKAVSLNPALLR